MSAVHQPERNQPTGRTATVKINAAGRETYLQYLRPDEPIYQKIADAGIMDEITVTAAEVERLMEAVSDVESTNPHWLNTASRVRGAAVKLGVF